MTNEELQEQREHFRERGFHDHGKCVSGKYVAAERADAEVTSTFQRRPCYRYIRKSDKLPTEIPSSQPWAETVCKVRLFNPTGIGTWWVASYDPDTGNAYGVADLHERSAGLIWIPELVDYRGQFGLPIERDLYYRPQTVAELMGIYDEAHADDEATAERALHAAVRQVHGDLD